MGLSGNKRYTFIIRIWREAREIEGKLPQWRGEIESASTGERGYFKSLDEITTFIVPFLERMGVQLETYEWAAKWLKPRTSISSEQDGDP